MRKSFDVIYVGNFLSKHGLAPSTAEMLCDKFKELEWKVKKTSSKKAIFLRAIDMSYTLLTCKANIVLIDTFSTTYFYYAVLAAFIARLTKKKIVPVLHGGDLPQRFIKTPKMFRWYLNMSARVVAPSGYLKFEIEKKWKGQVHIIPNCISVEDYKFKRRDKVKPKLLWVRSFHEIYNPYLAIEVVEKLKNMGYSDIELCMIGPDKDGSLERTKEKAMEMGVINNVVFTGKLSKEDWIRKSNYYEIFINTSNYDNTPISVIEAMALGLPVVSTNVGGIPYLIKNHHEGLLVSKNNSDEMADAIVQILEKKSLALKLSLNAKAKAELFSWKAIKEEWTKIIGQ